MASSGTCRRRGCLKVTGYSRDGGDSAGVHLEGTLLSQPRGSLGCCVAAAGRPVAWAGWQPMREAASQLTCCSLIVINYQVLAPLGPAGCDSCTVKQWGQEGVNGRPVHLSPSDNEGRWGGPWGVCGISWDE